MCMFYVTYATSQCMRHRYHRIIFLRQILKNCWNWLFIKFCKIRYYFSLSLSLLWYTKRSDFAMLVSSNISCSISDSFSVPTASLIHMRHFDKNCIFIVTFASLIPRTSSHFRFIWKVSVIFLLIYKYLYSLLPVQGQKLVKC